MTLVTPKDNQKFEVTLSYIEFKGYMRPCLSLESAPSKPFFPVTLWADKPIQQVSRPEVGAATLGAVESGNATSVWSPGPGSPFCFAVLSLQGHQGHRAYPAAMVRSGEDHKANGLGII